MTALKDIRVLDFTWYVVGPQTTRFLAAFGADIVLVERADDYSGIRRSNANKWNKFGPNLSGLFANLNPNKKGVTLNCRHPKGFEIACELAKTCDILIENFSSRVMESWGLGYETVRRLRPDIIYISMSGFGHTGPKRDYISFGPTAQAISGLTHLSGLPGEPPAGWGFSYMDHTGGYIAAIAALEALHYRDRTGQGQYLDLSVIEGAITLTGTSVLDKTVNGRGTRRPGYPPGNRSEHPRVAPHNSYRCMGKDDVGQDLWVAIVCFTDEHWRALRQVLGDPAWARDPRFDTNLGRVKHQDEIDAHIGRWTEDKDRFDAMYRCQEAGVPAGAAQNSKDRVEDDPQLKARNFYLELEHGELGRNKIEGMPFKLSRTNWGFSHAAPLWGQHSSQVYPELLGMTAEEIKRYKEEGVI